MRHISIEEVSGSILEGSQVHRKITFGRGFRHDSYDPSSGRCITSGSCRAWHHGPFNRTREEVRGTVTRWHGWEWQGAINEDTPPGRKLLELCALMKKDTDLSEVGLLVFGSSPLEFCAGLPVNSGDVDISPDQFYWYLKHKVSEWNLDRGDPHIQVCPSNVFKVGRNFSLRASVVAVDSIRVILPHPIDIVFGKLHRLEAKDYRDIDALVQLFGRPTSKDIKIYLEENSDILDLNTEQFANLSANIETIWSYLGGSVEEALDVQRLRRNAAVATESIVSEGSGNISKAVALARTIGKSPEQQKDPRSA